MKLPKDLKYDERTWVKADGDIATVGITDYALESVKEVAFIDLPEKGKKLKKGDDLVALESIKWSGHVASPVSGEVVEVNEALFDDPSKLNKDPYGSWACKMKMSDPDEVGGLMDAGAAEELAKKA